MSCPQVWGRNMPHSVGLLVPATPDHMPTRDMRLHTTAVTTLFLLRGRGCRAYRAWGTGTAPAAAPACLPHVGVGLLVRNEEIHQGRRCVKQHLGPQGSGLQCGLGNLGQCFQNSGGCCDVQHRSTERRLNRFRPYNYNLGCHLLSQRSPSTVNTAFTSPRKKMLRAASARRSRRIPRLSTRVLFWHGTLLYYYQTLFVLVCIFPH